MNALAAAALAAGELICEFNDGYRRSLLAGVAGDPPRTELLLVYEALQGGSPQVLASRHPGRHAVRLEEGREYVHLVQPDGASVRVTTLTGCTRTKWVDGSETCTRFTARHAWHFDSTPHADWDTSFRQLPTGAASGVCEPWRVD